MLAVLIIVGLVILAGVVFVSAGHGGELSPERNDYAPLDLGPVTATDVALLRPPANGWGYNMQATDEALARIAESIRERDVRIVALEQLVTDLGSQQAKEPEDAGAEETAETPEVTPPESSPGASRARGSQGSRQPGPPERPHG